MKFSIKNNYGSIIIGGGIGGLVCGCYLAKAGIKTVIIEQNIKTGGYCTSFVSNGFHFDACAHALASLRKGGKLNKLLEDLELSLIINRNDPSDVILTPNRRLEIFNSFEETVKVFMNNFPAEKNNVEKFFKFIVFSSDSNIIQLRNKTFGEMLKDFFNDEELISILSVITLLIVGLAPVKLSSVVACFLWREFIFDGGYYPRGGMQSFSDALTNRFIELGGEVWLSQKVEKIIIKKNQARGVLVNNKKVYGNSIISACDARQVFLNLIGKKHLKENMIRKIESREVSFSGFLVYLGLDKHCGCIKELKANHYIINNSNFQNAYDDFFNCKNDHLVITSSSMKDGSIKSKPSICLTTNAIFKSRKYWDKKRKDGLAKRLIEIAENKIPELSKHLAFKGIATPITLEYWTSNFKGSAYGWASTVGQFADPENNQKSKIENLYFTGHWANLSSGIPLVVLSSMEVAKTIIRKS